MKHSLKWVFLILMSAVLGACDNSTSSTGGGSTTNPSASSAPIKMVYIPKNTGNPYFDPLTDGFRKAAQELNIQFHSTAPATADATSQLPIIEDPVSYTHLTLPT